MVTPANTRWKLVFTRSWSFFSLRRSEVMQIVDRADIDKGTVFYLWCGSKIITWDLSKVYGKSQSLPSQFCWVCEGRTPLKAFRAQLKLLSICRRHNPVSDLIMNAWKARWLVSDNKKTTEMFRSHISRWDCEGWIPLKAFRAQLELVGT